ncbi:MAG TPA: hypothetical protein VJ485_02215 [archaeon]|nr:hypothetical protein [archaeon]
MSLLAEKKPDVTYASLELMRNFETHVDYVPFDMHYTLEHMRKEDPGFKKGHEITRKIREEAGLDK